MTGSSKREIKAGVHKLGVKNLVVDVKANPRDFYMYINGKKKDTQEFPHDNKGAKLDWPSRILKRQIDLMVS